MKSTWVVPWPLDSLPPMDSEDGYCLHYQDGYREDGTPLVKGGLQGCIGRVPQAPTCIVLVDTSEAVNALMKADERYLWLEDVVERTDAG